MYVSGGPAGAIDVRRSKILDVRSSCFEGAMYIQKGNISIVGVTHFVDNTAGSSAGKVVRKEHVLKSKYFERANIYSCIAQNHQVSPISSS